jgi:hypothetical protein
MPHRSHTPRTRHLRPITALLTAAADTLGACSTNTTDTDTETVAESTNAKALKSGETARYGGYRATDVRTANLSLAYLVGDGVGQRRGSSRFTTAGAPTGDATATAAEHTTGGQVRRGGRRLNHLGFGTTTQWARSCRSSLWNG